MNLNDNSYRVNNHTSSTKYFSGRRIQAVNEMYSIKHLKARGV